MNPSMAAGKGLPKGGVPAGEETRRDPVRTDFSSWLHDRITSLPMSGTAAFPASFDRSIWPRPEDEEPGPIAVRVASPPRNILELYPMQACKNFTANADWRIAVTLLTCRGPIARAAIEVLPTEGSMLAGWTLMGYDVLDSGFAISGLLNCGDPVVEIARRLLNDWSTQLTQFYLWPSPDIAELYAYKLDEAVRDHAPFEVVGMYRCKQPA